MDTEAAGGPDVQERSDEQSAVEHRGLSARSARKAYTCPLGRLPGPTAKRHGYSAAVWAALALSLLGGSVEVGGATRCPAVADVTQRLAALLPAGGADRPLQRATIEDGSGTLEIELRDASGSLLAHRAIDRARPCSDLAEAAAVMIAAWVSALPESPLALAIEPGPSTPPLPLRLEIGVGLFGSLTGDRTVRPGAVVEAWLDWARVALFGSWTREGAIGPGRYSWLRAGLSLGLRLPLFAAWIELRADAIAAVLTVAGAGLTAARRDWDLDPGGSLGVRATLPLGLGSHDPFVEASATGWFRRQQISVEGLTEQVVLPRLEGILLVGVPVGGTR